MKTTPLNKNIINIFIVLSCLIVALLVHRVNVAYADNNNAISKSQKINGNNALAKNNSNVEEHTTLEKILISGVEVLDYKNDEKLKDPAYYKNDTKIVLNSKNKQHKIYLYTSTTSTKIPTEIVNVWLYNNDIMAMVPVTVDNTNPNWHAPSSKIIPNEFINGTWGLDIFSTKTDPKTKKKTQELLGSFNFTIELKP